MTVQYIFIWRVSTKIYLRGPYSSRVNLLKKNQKYICHLTIALPVELAPAVVSESDGGWSSSKFMILWHFVLDYNVTMEKPRPGRDLIGTMKF